MTTTTCVLNPLAGNTTTTTQHHYSITIQHYYQSTLFFSRIKDSKDKRERRGQCWVRFIDLLNWEKVKGV